MKVQTFFFHFRKHTILPIIKENKWLSLLLTIISSEETIIHNLPRSYFIIMILITVLQVWL